MYNVVVFSGGTGSTAIQEGFSALYGHESIKFDIIINAYDNGLSTGACRKVFENRILGPSDLRKNQLTQFRLLKKNELKDWWSRESVLWRLFELRIDAETKEDYYAHACEQLDNARRGISNRDFAYLREMLDFFFFEDIEARVWRHTLENIKFNDFSLANVFYSSSAVRNGFSLRLAGTEMASFLGIPDNVHLISDVNIYLQALTESGKLIEDEGDIVVWDNRDDRIKDVILLKDGKMYLPSVDEGTDTLRVRSCRELVADADLIIFSSGTQWSSLIPTYVHEGFREMIEKSTAKKYLVINTSEDHDMWGVSADETVEVLRRYLPLEDVVAVVNKDAASGLSSVTSMKSISGHIGAGARKHNPVGLIRLIITDWFGLSDFRGKYVFDLDGTLWDETASGHGKSVGAENMNLFRGIVHSGNSYEHVRDVFKHLYWRDEVVDIYSDFGNVHFTSNNYESELLYDEYIVEQGIIEKIESVPEFSGKTKLRGKGCVVTVKPLVDRETLLEKAKSAIANFNGRYEAKIAGHTSIDITRTGYDKSSMLPRILSRHGIDPGDVVFVGNEVELGAEDKIWESGVVALQVNDVFECNVLLRTIASWEGCLT